MRTRARMKTKMKTKTNRKTKAKTKTRTRTRKKTKTKMRTKFWGVQSSIPKDFYGFLWFDNIFIHKRIVSLQNRAT